METGKQKFGDTERRRVIEELEKLFSMKLTPIKSYKKYLSGTDGKKYCIVGGYEEWHGVPDEVIVQDQAGIAKTVLVVAVVLRDKIEMFLGPIEPLAKNRDMLTLVSGGGYQFNIKSTFGGRMYIKELSDYSLSKIQEFSYSPREKDKEKSMHGLVKEFKRLSPQARERFLMELKELKSEHDS